MAGPVAAAFAEEAIVSVHKDPSCGCCLGWVRHIRDAGFVVQGGRDLVLGSVRSRLGVPPELTACHTTEVNR